MSGASIRKIRSSSAEVTARVRRDVMTAVYAAADVVRVDAALSITRGSISGKNHVPSRPGQPPNADTRQLDTGIVVKPYPERLASQVVSTAPHGVHQELGTATMAPRPYLRPALRRKRGQIVKMIERAARVALKGGAT